MQASLTRQSSSCALAQRRRRGEILCASSSSRNETNAQKRIENLSRFVQDNSWTAYEKRLQDMMDTGRALRSVDDGASCSENVLEEECLIPSGPYCPYFGPIASLSKRELEVLYKQAREGFYSGRPFMSDSVYDDLELRLRLLGSAFVRKYPRCSLTKSRPMYADAEEDYVQVSMLAVVWGALFLLGFGSILTPALIWWLEYTRGATGAGASLPLIAGLGVVLGMPLMTTSYRGFKQLQEGYLVAMRGQCPQCGSEVYAFLSSSQYTGQQFVREASECHVCNQRLEFRAFVVDTKGYEVPVPLWSPIRSVLKRGAYGRVYGRASTSQLGPDDHPAE